MKIGVIVITSLKKMLEAGKVEKEEIEKMKTKEYSKKPLLFNIPPYREQL